MKMTKFIVLVLAVSAFITAGAGAQTISVNLAEGDSGAPRANQTVLPEEVAGLDGYEVANWNNAQLDSSGMSLIDDSGAETGVILNFDVENGWGDNTADGSVDGANDKIARGYFDDTDTDGLEIIGVDIEVLNIPYGSYDVVLYLGTDTSHTNWTPMTVGGETLTGAPLDQFGTKGGWIEGENVLIFRGLEGSTLDIELPARYADGDGTARGCLSGFQIVLAADLKAKMPDPANKATDVNPDQIVLSWMGPEDYVATGYDVYLGTDGNDLSPYYFRNTQVVFNEDVLSYGPVDLDYATTYYWGIDTYDPNNGSPVVHEGDAWSFTTDKHPSQKGLSGGTTPAGLSLANASFESITATGDDGAAWGYDIDYWYEGFSSGFAQCFWEIGSAIGLESDLELWAGLETGGAYYQNIGTVVPGQSYVVRMLIGARGGNFGTGSVSFYAGGGDINAGNGVVLSGFATELDTASFGISDGIAISTNVYEVSVILNIPDGVPAGETLWFQFKSETGKDYFDNIKFYVPLDSRAVWGPSPAVGEIGVGVQTGTILSWQAGVDDVNYETLEGITDYHVYASTDRNAVLEATTSTAGVYQGSTGGATEISVTVPSDSTIHWRVDEVIGGETLKGRIWSFETELLLATITEAPVSAVIDSGAVAELSVVVDSFSAEGYSWKQITGSGDIEVGTSATLTTGEAGAYYCIITNSAGSIETGTVHVTIKQLMGYWNFDGNLVSSVNAAHTGTVASDNYTDDAVSGQAWGFFGDPNMIIIDNSADDYNFYPQGYTVSAWIKTTQGGWGAYVAKQDKTSGNKGFILTHAGNSGITTLRESFNDLSSGDAGVADGEWHHVAGTFNAVTGVAQVFVDGVLANTSSDNFPNLTLTDVPLFFGGETTDGSVAFVGLLDEVKIWNYALNAYEVAGEYTGIRTDVTICVEIDQFDFNEDCVVDLADFAAFAASWMDCNLVPCIE